MLQILELGTMLRISKNMGKITSMKRGDFEIDSFVIIPGVTQYQHIYTKGNWIIFDGKSSYIGVEFTSDSDLERFFVQLMREIKLNQITNVNVDVDTKSK